MLTRFIKGAAFVAATTTLSTYALAQYGSGSAYHSGSSYSSVSNTYAGVASPSYADARYGTGSISNSYAGSNVEIFGFSGAPSGAVGLAHNESLRATNCPTSVYNPEGGRVLGCYDVVAPAAPTPIAQTSYYRVVRPVIYVRYPVYQQYVAPRPVARQPVCNTNAQPAWTSRYGQNGFSAPKGNNCGW